MLRDVQIEAIDTLSRLRREIVKATCLSWDISTEYFEPLAFAVDKRDFSTVHSLAVADAVFAGAKAELISDILLHMADTIDAAQAKFSASQGACNKAEGEG